MSTVLDIIQSTIETWESLSESSSESLPVKMMPHADVEFLFAKACGTADFTMFSALTKANPSLNLFSADGFVLYCTCKGIVDRKDDLSLFSWFSEKRIQRSKVQDSILWKQNLHDIIRICSESNRVDLLQYVDSLGDNDASQCEQLDDMDLYVDEHIIRMPAVFWSKTDRLIPTLALIQVFGNHKRTHVGLCCAVTCNSFDAFKFWCLRCIQVVDQFDQTNSLTRACDIRRYVCHALHDACNKNATQWIEWAVDSILDALFIVHESVTHSFQQFFSAVCRHYSPAIFNKLVSWIVSRFTAKQTTEMSEILLYALQIDLPTAKRMVRLYMQLFPALQECAMDAWIHEKQYTFFSQLVASNPTFEHLDYLCTCFNMPTLFIFQIACEQNQPLLARQIADKLDSAQLGKTFHEWIFLKDAQVFQHLLSRDGMKASVSLEMFQRWFGDAVQHANWALMSCLLTEFPEFATSVPQPFTNLALHRCIRSNVEPLIQFVLNHCVDQAIRQAIRIACMSNSVFAIQWFMDHHKLIPEDVIPIACLTLCHVQNDQFACWIKQSVAVCEDFQFPSDYWIFLVMNDAVHAIQWSLSIVKEQHTVYQTLFFAACFTNKFSILKFLLQQKPGLALELLSFAKNPLANSLSLWRSICNQEYEGTFIHLSNELYFTQKRDILNPSLLECQYVSDELMNVSTMLFLRTLTVKLYQQGLVQ